MNCLIAHFAIEIKIGEGEGVGKRKARGKVFVIIEATVYAKEDMCHRVRADSNSLLRMSAHDAYPERTSTACIK